MITTTAPTTPNRPWRRRPHRRRWLPDLMRQESRAPFVASSRTRAVSSDHGARSCNVHALSEMLFLDRPVAEVVPPAGRARSEREPSAQVEPEEVLSMRGSACRWCRSRAVDRDWRAWPRSTRESRACGRQLSAGTSGRERGRGTGPVTGARTSSMRGYKGRGCRDGHP